MDVDGGRMYFPARWPHPLQSFIAGAFRKAGGESVDVINKLSAVTGEIVYQSEVAERELVEEAVQVAKKGQMEWAKYSPTERGRVLTRAARLLTERNEEYAKLEAFDTGRPIQETIAVDIISARDCFEYYGGLATTVVGEHMDMPGGSFAYTRREPLGVTAGIGAWNYPIQGIAWKAAPSLACGNSIIVKPSELTPLTAIALGETLKEAGLPDGCFNVVLGAGGTGSLLSEHPEIAKVSFTGGASTGRKVVAAASATLKNVSMELGGKSPLIIFEDCDIEEAVKGALMANFYSAGQVCSNGTRVYVADSIFDEFLEKLVAKTERIVLGDPMDMNTQMGPLVSYQHLEKVMGYIEQGLDEGARLLTGGERVMRPGAYLTPAIFVDCDDTMTIVREEIFGPVACVMRFKTEEEVIKRANDTIWGLSAGVFTKDLTRAHRVIAQLEAGTTWINNYNLAPVELPWGGNKQSGIGRENGREGIHSWSQLKSVYVEMNRVECPYE